MNELYKFLGLPGVLFVFIILLVSAIVMLRAIINKAQKDALNNRAALSYLVKKHPDVALSKYNGLIANIAVIFSLGLVLVLFEFPSFEKQSLVTLNGEMSEIEEMQEIPPTEHLPPPPPKLQQPEIVVVADNEVIEQEIEVDFDMEVTEDEVIEEVTFNMEEAPEEEVIEEIFEIVEDPAAPANGYAEFYAFVGQNMKYPRRALELGVAGKVYLRFVVDKDGSITEVEVVRGVGAGCDEEAVRVLKMAPKWKPGKQRGRAVKQRMVIPITFKIANM